MALFINKGDGFQKLSVPDALRLLGVAKLPSQSIRQFEYSRIKTKLDPHNPGRRVLPRSWTSKPEFSVYLPSLGFNVSVRWGQTMQSVVDHGIKVEKFNPKSIVFEGSAIQVGDDDSLFAFWYLHPNNKQSPFRKLNSPYYWEFTDQSADAEVDINSIQDQTMAFGLIVGDKAWSYPVLKILAKGMGIANVDQMEPEVVKASLIRMAKENPKEFYSKAQSHTIPFNGTIQDAIDQNVITLVNKNGMQRWHFGTEEICLVSVGVSNPLDVLRDHISNNMHIWFDRIKMAISQRGEEKKLEGPEYASYFEKGEVAESPSDLGRKGANQIAMAKNAIEHEEELKRLSQLDINDPKLHFKTKEKILRMQPEIDAYLARQQAPVEQE